MARINISRHSHTRARQAQREAICIHKRQRIQAKVDAYYAKQGASLWDRLDEVERGIREIQEMLAAIEAEQA